MYVVGGRGPLSDLEAKNLDDSEWVVSECHRFSVSISGAKQLVMNLGLFVMDKVSIIDAPYIELIVKAVANLYVSSAAGIDAIFAEQNAANESNEALLPVLPHQLETLSHSEFCSVVWTQRKLLGCDGVERHLS